MGSSPVVQALKLGARENPSVKIVSNPGAPSSTFVPTARVIIALIVLCFCAQ